MKSCLKVASPDDVYTTKWNVLLYDRLKACCELVFTAFW